jgi:hypothetical protein
VGDYLCGWVPLKGLPTTKMSMGCTRGSVNVARNEQVMMGNVAAAGGSTASRGALMDAYVGVFRGMIPGLLLKFKVMTLYMSSPCRATEQKGKACVGPLHRSASWSLLF